MLSIPPHLVQRIADYLVTCPYKDVARMLDEIAQLRSVPAPSPEPEKK